MQKLGVGAQQTRTKTEERGRGSHAKRDLKSAPNIEDRASAQAWTLEKKTVRRRKGETHAKGRAEKEERARERKVR